MFRALVLTIRNAFAVGQTFSPFCAIANQLTALVGCKIGRGTQISESFYIYSGRQFEIGAFGCVGTHCRIYDFESICIGDRLLASHGLTLISGTHDKNTYDYRPAPITIGNDVWIGINVTIVGPINIGDGAVIGAGSLVIRDVPERSIVAGVPAKVLRSKD